MGVNLIRTGDDIINLDNVTSIKDMRAEVNDYQKNCINIYAGEDTVVITNPQHADALMAFLEFRAYDVLKWYAQGGQGDEHK